MECTEPDRVSPCPGGGQGMQQVEYSVRCDVVVANANCPRKPQEFASAHIRSGNQTQTRPSETRPVLSPVPVLLLLTLSRDIRRHSIQAIRVCKLQKIGAIDAF